MQATGKTTPRPGPGTESQFVRDLGGFMKFLLGYGQGEFFEAVADLDLSISQLRMLHALSRDADGASLGALAENTGLSLPTASRTVDSLVQRGFATRAESPADRRVKTIRPTAEALDATARLVELRLAGLEGFVGTLPAAERDALAAALAPIVAREEIAPLCRPERDRSDA